MASPSALPPVSAEVGCYRLCVMDARVISVVRSAARLENLVHATRDAQDPEQPWTVEHACALRPFAPGSDPELWAAWSALAAVTAWDAATADHVLTVLLQTVPSGDEAGEVPALGPDVHPALPPRATAAHPRAFRGTHRRPPKPPRPEPVDLRRHLLARRHIDQVLDLLRDQAPQLARFPRGTDPYLGTHFGIAAGPGFDPWFVQHVLPLLQSRPWSEVNRLAALARALDLQREEALRATLVGVLIAADDAERASGWWSHVLAQESGCRLETAQMVYASGAAARDPDLPAEALADVARTEPRRRWSFYRGLAAGATPDYLLAGLRLTEALPHLRIDEPPPGRDDVEAVVRATIERLGTALERDSGPEFWTAHLWRLCGEQPALLRLLEAPAFAALVPPAAFWLLRLAGSPRWTPETAEREIPVLARGVLDLAARAAAVEPVYQLKLVEDVADIYWKSCDDGRDYAAAIERALRFATRVARAPFAARPVIGPVARWLVWLDPQGLDALLAAPDASFLALERACRRENDARLLGLGLEVLSARQPDLVIAAFAKAPNALFATADALAALSRETQADVIAGYERTPLASASLASQPLEQLVDLVTPVAQAGGPDPVRRALRRHLAGERRLGDAQVRGHHARIVAALDEVRLAAIRQEAERALAARAQLGRIESPALRHALALLGEADENRRQLRRLLLAHLAGDHTWRLRHPETRAWLARHPRLDATAWLAGLTLRGQVEGLGEVTLTIETDPLEALKAGTYLGTCLGRGGGLSWSAAALVLDINKHVVYARDARDTVVGRQLLAISEADELICFTPYTASHTTALEPLFRDFNQAFAARLGLPVLGRNGDEGWSYEVASILSRQWWDDMPWDLNEGTTKRREGVGGVK